MLYHERWEIELTFDEQKTHQSPWRVTKPADLRSQTPRGVLQELYALSLGHFVVRALMLEASTQQHLDVDRLSFSGCLRILQARLPEGVRARVDLVDDWTATQVRFDAVLHHGSVDELLAVTAALASRAGPIVAVEGSRPGETALALERLVVERALSVNTAAAGGNATLMTLQ